MAKARRIGAIDIGSTKVACVIAETDQSGKTSIVGFGTSVPDGFKQGMVINLDKAVESVEGAVRAAEGMAGGKFHTLPVFVGIAGEHIKHLTGIGAVTVRKPSRGIGPADVAEVMKQAQTIRLPQDETILHVVPTQFIVDGQKGVRNPLGLFGVRLEVEVMLIIGAVTSVENIYRVCERLEVKSRSLALASIASFHGVCDEEDKDLGVVLLDLGGTTDIAIYKDGEIRFVKFLPVGATNITRDIAIGLRTTVQQAEDVKRRFGAAMASIVEKDEAITVDEASGRGTKQVSRRLVASIIEPRAEEILSMALDEARKSGLMEGLSGGVVLTGGGSQLPGIEVMAEQLFGMPVRLGRPDKLTAPREVVQDPGFATAVGLIRCGIEGKCVSCFPEMSVWSKAADEVKSWFS